MATETIVGVFHSVESGQQAITALEASNIKLHNTSLMAQSEQGSDAQAATLVVVKAEEADALEVRRILAHAGADSIRENQTDMAGAGAIHVDMHNQNDMPINTPFSNVETGAGGTAARPTPLPEIQGDRVQPQTALTDEAVPNITPPTPGASGEATSFDTEDRRETDQSVGQTMENGVRIVSYEEEDALKREANK